MRLLPFDQNQLIDYFSFGYSNPEKILQIFEKVEDKAEIKRLFTAKYVRQNYPIIQTEVEGLKKYLIVTYLENIKSKLTIDANNIIKYVEDDLKKYVERTQEYSFYKYEINMYRSLIDIKLEKEVEKMKEKEELN